MAFCVPKTLSIRGKTVNLNKLFTKLKKFELGYCKMGTLHI